MLEQHIMPQLELDLKLGPELVSDLAQELELDSDLWPEPEPAAPQTFPKARPLSQQSTSWEMSFWASQKCKRQTSPSRH